MEEKIIEESGESLEIGKNTHRDAILFLGQLTKYCQFCSFLLNEFSNPLVFECGSTLYVVIFLK